MNWWDEADLWWTDTTPQQWRAAGRDEWELCARVWVEEVRVVRQALEQLESSRVLDVSYERLVAAPHETLATIATFAGLAPSDAWDAAVAEVVFANQNEAWRTALDAGAKAKIEAVQGEELRRHGYA